ncbi:TetR/AcrR family transcriptional regulator [Monashia sp. NPDC004114]
MVQRPTRARRPANRRALILAAATNLFAEHGFEHVSIGQVAEAVEVGPSALYRHVSGKEQLLADVIADVADRFIELLTSQADSPDLLLAVATFALDHRTIGVLWQREARHLPPESHDEARARMREAQARFGDALTAVYPALRPVNADAVSAAVLAVVLSPSFHRVQLPRPAYDVLVADLAERVVKADLPGPDAPRRPAERSGLTRASKREQVLRAALRLFAERSYASVSMEDVAASVGMAASSLYNHFPSKLDMLSSGVHRANGYVQLSLDDTLAAAQDPKTALRGLVASYTRYALAHPDLVDVLISEVRNLPSEEASVLIQAQRDFVDEWVHLHRQLHPELQPAASRIVVLAALTVSNDLARTPGVSSRASAEAIISALARQVLNV